METTERILTDQYGYVLPSQYRAFKKYRLSSVDHDDLKFLVGRDPGKQIAWLVTYCEPGNVSDVLDEALRGWANA